MADTTKFRTDRVDSTASTTSATSAGSPPAAMPTSPTTGGRRRSSQGLFEGLTAQKRKDDPISIARRQSMSDQRPKPGFIGQMWSNWVYGHSK
ncbi:hypothetical protein B0T18DRAFT_428959 [Schizothecium vesticola]|uniref:Conidiation-specific protein 8 n=1 Tax=Schizothecium vesticola TaxID=314040 RepID=A0AA40K4S6_9PEZI|nr:hypothetical protein B0T18DRAFT_428959 [Schizothecium vesticola]